MKRNLKVCTALAAPALGIVLCAGNPGAAITHLVLLNDTRNFDKPNVGTVLKLGLPSNPNLAVVKTLPMGHRWQG
jgi:hypothetical protein